MRDLRFESSRSRDIRWQRSRAALSASEPQSYTGSEGLLRAPGRITRSSHERNLQKAEGGQTLCLGQTLKEIVLLPGIGNKR